MSAIPELAKLSSSHTDLKVIGINVEDVFGPQPKVDLDALVKEHKEINFTIGQDLSRATIEALLKPAQRQALPSGESALVACMEKTV